MKFGIISYNIYGNFTNYGSVLQSWALQQAINRMENGKYQAIIVDYCPDILLGKNPCNPLEHMWDTDEESRRMCRLSLPAIRKNYEKFERFYNIKLEKTQKRYTSDNFNDIILDEKFDGFICGSDTIWCIDELGFDDGYYANYPAMKNGYVVAYAASFGDSHFTPEQTEILNELLQNFKVFGLRENEMIPYVREHTSAPVQQVIDPTLLLSAEDYEEISVNRLESEKYLLLYSRRYNPKMEVYAEKIAAERGWKVIEISLRATNATKHRMFYDAGVEEFLSLVKHAEYIVTNSYHGMIFSIQFQRPFVIFSRTYCDTKIMELLSITGLTNRRMTTGDERLPDGIKYQEVNERIKKFREQSLAFLEFSLRNCPQRDIS